MSDFEITSTGGTAVKTSDQIALLSAVISFVALVGTLVFAALNRRYTREQIKLLANQVQDQRDQFKVTNTPDVKIHVWVRGVEPKGVFMEATNNHATIPVGDLIVFAEGVLPSQQPYVFTFGIFNDLKPQETIKVESFQTFEGVVRKYFPGYEEEGLLSETAYPGESFESFPMTLSYSYLPRQTGATKVERSMPLFLLVSKKKTADGG